MKISVIIPYHGEEQFLPDCLDSLCAQEFRDFEVIIICADCSVPDDIIRTHGAALTVRTETISGEYGVAAARNRGLELAVGEYVYFIDCDDYLYAGAFAGLVDSLALKEEELGEKIDMVYGRCVLSWFRRSVFVPILEERIAAKEEQARLENGEEDSEADENEEEEAEGRDDNETDDMAGADSISVQKIYGLVIEEEHIPYNKQNAVKRLLRNKKGLKSVSVLSVLFRRDFLNAEGIRFDEELVYYSDLPFMTQALQKGQLFLYNSSSIYIKRNHNDPIHEPSLSQMQDENKFYEYIRSFEEARKNVPEKGLLDYVLVRKIIDYYAGYASIKLRRDNSGIWMGEYFDRLKELFLTFDKCHFKPLRKYKKRAVRALLKKDAKGCLDVTNRYLARNKIKRFITKKGELYRFLYKYVFSKKKIEEKYVIFESFFGKSYSDSPKYIYEYLMKNYKDKGYKCIWSYSDKKFKLPYGGKCVKRYGLMYSYYVAKCKYFVYNVRQPYWLKKRKGQVFLETWHGTPLKKLFFDMDEVYSASPLSKKQVYTQSKEWDYLIAPNYFSSKVFRSCFAYENEMLETGYPRNDIMHSENREEIAERIRKKLKIPKDKKTILYAPTWRDDEYYGKGKYKFTLQLDLGRMKKELAGEYVILLRTHYYIADSLDINGVEDFAINVSKYNDISELYLISDILITDYSSVFFDYANLKRPMLFFTYDLEKYRDILRGFYIDIEEELPGPLLYTNDDVLGAFKRLPEIIEENKEKYERFYEKYCGIEDGHASEKVVKKIFLNIMEEQIGTFNK